MSMARIAIVTGAAQGIGKANSLRLAHDGLDVVVNDLESKSKELDVLVAEIVALKRRSIAIVGDVSQEADVHNLVCKAVAEFGGLDVVRDLLSVSLHVLTVNPQMVANAGIGRTGPIVSCEYG